MSIISKEQVTDILNTVIIPNQNISIIEAKLVSAIVIRSLDIGFVIEVNNYLKNNIDSVTEECHSKLKTLGASKITIVQTNIDHIKDTKYIGKYRISNVKKIYIVASGKGGVGKSTSTINLAITALSYNLRVGIIDADINGPSIAHMLNMKDKPLFDNGKICPLKSFGIEFLSMGNLIDQNLATIWRSPMYAKILNQIIVKANWSDLDIIFIDVPPGTGEIHLSLAEKYDIDGVIMVSTPNILSLLDVEKAFNMYENLKLPIIGIIENIISKRINNANLVLEFANKKNIDFLDTIEFDSRISELGDEGLSQDNYKFVCNVYEKVFNKLLKFVKM